MRGARLRAYVALLALAAYANSLRNGFVFDDNSAIVHNRYARPGEPLWPVLTSRDFWGNDIRRTQSHKSYRPLVTLSYRLNAMLARARAPPGEPLGALPGEPSGAPPSAWGYHATNALLHAAVCALACDVCAACLGDDGGGGRARSAGAARRQLVCATLFALHPVHCEAVANLVGRAELLAACCVCCAFALHARAAADGARAAVAARGTACADVPRVLGGCALFARRARAQPSATAAGVRRRVGRLARGAAARLLPYALVAAAYLLLRVAIMSPRPGDADYEQPPSLHPSRPPPPPPGARAALRALTPAWAAHWSWDATTPSPLLVRKAENPLTTLLRPPTADESPESARTRRVSYWLSALHASCYHALLLLWPAQLSIEYSFDCVPLVASLADPRAWLDLAAAALLGTLVLARLRAALGRGCARACRDTRAAAWLLLPWLPCANVLFPIGTFIAERLLYLPSLGAALCVAQAALPRARAAAATAAPPSPSRRAASPRAAAALGCACAALGVRCLLRNLDWLSDESAFLAARTVCPRSAKLQLQWGTLLRSRGDLDGALAHARLAAAIDPDFCDTAFHEALALVLKGNARDAVPLLNQSLSCAFTVRRALPLLNDMYAQLLAQTPHDAAVHRWAASTYAALPGGHGRAAMHLASAARAVLDGGAPAARAVDDARAALALAPADTELGHLLARALLARASEAERGGEHGAARLAADEAGTVLRALARAGSERGRRRDRRRGGR
ncbi:hypothetical protein KFE25_004382 [Diacronema lutheri]|uniref:DUF1736 domain-containing protein n=1 Tax=Diacronema lutheri TaxID=2081491 RepID=A0A8J5X789_DIALT|nr:hypothetical protein KFE25_004382 [Diacronema lutheri]